MGIHFYREFEKHVHDDTEKKKVEEAILKDLQNATDPPSLPQTQGQGSGHETEVIAASAAASVTLAMVIVGAILLRLRLKKKREREKLRAKYDVYPTIPTAPPLLVNTQRQLSHKSDVTPVTCYDSMNIVTERPQFEGLEMSKYDENSKRFQQKLYKFHSFESTGRGEKEPPKLRRSKSVTSLDDRSLVTGRKETNIRVAFSLKYVKNLRQVNLKLHNISELPSKTYGLDVYAVVYLFPRSNEGVNSRNTKGDKTVKLEQTFLFDDLTLNETEKSTLRIALFYRRRIRLAKEEFLGELFLKCSEVDWSLQQPTRFEIEVHKNRAKRESTSDKYLFADLGSLFVCLEYQLAAKRMKVMVRKACNLPKSDRLIGRPAHYVIINLLQNKELVKTQETRTVGGCTPVWNQPFLFDLPGDSVNDFCFDFIVMRGKIRTKDGVVGHVMIGADSTKEGNKHWKEILSPRPLETAKWHNIMPLINFKPNVEPGRHKARKDS